MLKNLGHSLNCKTADLIEARLFYDSPKRAENTNVWQHAATALFSDIYVSYQFFLLFLIVFHHNEAF